FDFVMFFCFLFFFFFFFFQAEDGIRDRTVTGVQTCALPILSPSSSAEKQNTPSRRRILFLCGRRGRHPHSPHADVGAMRLIAVRSEERRVGKECSSRRGTAE